MAIANAIREKSSMTAPLSFPAGMVAAVRDIQSESGSPPLCGRSTNIIYTHRLGP